MQNRCRFSHRLVNERGDGYSPTETQDLYAVQIIVNCLFLSSFYLSFAIGLTLIFGVMQVVNYAHGEIFMAGGYTLYLTASLLHGLVPGAVVLAAAFVAAIAVGGALGLLIYFGLIKRLKDQPLSIFMATLALSYVLQVVIIQIFGPMGRSIPY